MKKLDKSKPFSEVFGNDPSINYRFMQGGHKFDEAGDNIDPNAEDTVTAEKAGETEAEMRARIEAEFAAKQDAAVKAGETEAEMRARIEAEFAAKQDAAVKAAVEKALAEAGKPAGDPPTGEKDGKSVLDEVGTGTAGDKPDSKTTAKKK